MAKIYLFIRVHGLKFIFESMTQSLFTQLMSYESIAGGINIHHRNALI